VNLTGQLKTMIDCGKDKLSYSCANYYIPTEHLAAGEIVLFRGRVIFKQYIQKKHKWLGIQMYNILRANGPLFDDFTY